MSTIANSKAADNLELMLKEYEDKILSKFVHRKIHFFYERINELHAIKNKGSKKKIGQILLEDAKRNLRKHFVEKDYFSKYDNFEDILSHMENVYTTIYREFYRDVSLDIVAKKQETTFVNEDKTKTDFVTSWEKRFTKMSDAKKYCRKDKLSNQIQFPIKWEKDNVNGKDFLVAEVGHVAYSIYQK